MGTLISNPPPNNLVDLFSPSADKVAWEVNRVVGRFQAGISVADNPGELPVTHGADRYSQGRCKRLLRHPDRWGRKELEDGWSPSVPALPPVSFTKPCAV